MKPSTLVFAAFLFVVTVAAQTPQPTMTPVPTATPFAIQKTVQTLADIQSKIRARLLAPELRRGQVGVKIVSLNSGKVVFEENAEKYFMPASNMKNFTVAAALDRLGPNYRFVTSVYAPSMPDGSGTIKGNLRVFGRGDVSISTSFAEGNYYKGLDELADKIMSAGVKRVDGDLIADETYFSGSPVPGTWEWDDLQWYYGAEVSALPLNDNAIDLSVLPGPVGYQCAVRINPTNAVIRVINQCTTSPAGTQRTLRIEKKVDRNILEITGSLPVGNNGFKGYVTVSRPAELFISLLRERLALKGVTVTGQARAVNLKPAISEPSVEITKLESPPLSLIAAKTMKPSQNMYTETLLWTLGEHSRATTAATPGGGTVAPSTADSAELGIAAVKKFLGEIGVAPDGIIQHDGSGLSRHNLITPSAVVQLYSYMGKQSKVSQAWRDSLTIGGVDGTLRRRFVGTRAAGNVRGKTGTIDQVSALSGYVTTAAGEELVFSMVVNGINEASVRTAAIDEIVLSLASFDGKVD
ncbi:MAG TPA: D-alanyl-D-alanine carboxypeptidase/D-alanyl-D-alanine-endopeptidase [Pyrinomonadaceae bacterium]